MSNNKQLLNQVHLCLETRQQQQPIQQQNHYSVKHQPVNQKHELWNFFFFNNYSQLLRRKPDFLLAAMRAQRKQQEPLVRCRLARRWTERKWCFVGAGRRRRGTTTKRKFTSRSTSTSRFSKTNLFQIKV